MDNLTNGMGGQVDAGMHQPTERVYTQAELNAIAAKIKQEAYEKAQRLQAEQPDYFAQRHGSQREDVEAANAKRSEEVKRLVAEQMAAERERMQQEILQGQYQTKVRNIVDEFEKKGQAGAQKYTDYSTLVNQESMSDFPMVVATSVENLDNAEDVLYELAKDPLKLAQLELITSKQSQKAGLAVLKKMSADLKKKGDIAVEENLSIPTNNFIKKLTSSANVASAPKSGGQSVDDFRKMFKI